MSDTIISSARVPSNLYIERDADKQLRRIINDMARPGYVLVARQMGKTNLLLHAKALLENEKNLFVYVDFSTMTDYTERECLNYLIDTAIEINYPNLQEAEDEISTLRSLQSYNATRMFGRELRILLKYVEKIVFVLDEIDALARRQYSDRVFSMIRGHYYANTNFPELKRATFILSGVIEPKDIIKDPNISPFNIGEKIYLNDFTKSEFFSLADKIEYLKQQPNVVRERLYYWSKGQPRISWDLCVAAEQCKVKTEADVNNLVKRMYLTRFDRPPIDSIRDLIQSDTVLKDALIQLSINKGEALGDKVVSRLYLAGIINYNQTVPDFKNPIMAASLSYDWLISIHGRNIDYISEAEKSINLEKDYRKAITLLTAFISDSKDLSKCKLNRAHFLLAKAYYRNFNAEEAYKELDLLIPFDDSYNYYYEARLLRGTILTSLSNNLEAEREFKGIIEKISTGNDEILLKAKMYLARVLIEQEDDLKLKEAETVLLEMLKHNKDDLLKTRQLPTIFYYLASIEEKRGNSKQCVNYLDTALLSAQSNEKQRLLYLKYQNTTDKDNCALQLYNSLEDIKSKPEAESFENILILNTFYASLILADLMISYPQYDVTKYLRLFLYDSKESAVIFIYSILAEYFPEKAAVFFHILEKLIDDYEWQFQQSELMNLALIQIVKFHEFTICDDLLNACLNDKASLPYEIQDMILARLADAMKNKQYTKAKSCIDYYRAISNRIVKHRKRDWLLIEYCESVILYMNDEISQFENIALSLLANLESYLSSDCDISDFDEWITPKACNQIKISTENKLRLIQVTRKNLGLLPTHENLGRNAVIGVRYELDGIYREGKYKKLKNDLELGKCKIEKIVRK